jgi:LacI family transcriptional regulator
VVPQKNVTLSDVAAVAGVSISTVSKALNGGGRISESTRIRVVEVAQRLDFRPNALAQSFARGRSETIGILTHRAVGTWSAPILVGATSCLGRHEQAALHYDGRFEVATLTAHIRKLRARRIDGVLIIGDGPQDTVRSVTGELAVPVVYAFTSTDDPRDATFVPDSVLAGRLAGRHLLEIGRRRIAHITAGGDIAAAQRRQGLAEVLAESGREPAALIDEGGSFSESWGRTGAARLLASGVAFDAVFCGNDHIARGAEQVFRAHGMTVPDDVALVGVDNWEGIVVGQEVHHLTTIDLRLAALGAAAAEHVRSGAVEPGRHDFGCELVIGESTTGAAGFTAGGGTAGPAEPAR